MTLKATRLKQKLPLASSPEIYEQVAKITKDLTGNFLDLGAGQGNFTKVLIEQAHEPLFACDLDPSGFEPQGIKCFKTDLNKITPFESNSFDNIVCLEVIEHLENPWHLLEEVKRILKKGGIFILTTPNNSSLLARFSFLFRAYLPAFSPSNFPRHMTALTKWQLVSILKIKGFKIKNIFFTDSGRMPKTDLPWQRILPWLKGEYFSDNIVIVSRKNKL